MPPKLYHHHALIREGDEAIQVNRAIGEAFKARPYPFPKLIEIRSKVWYNDTPVIRREGGVSMRSVRCFAVLILIASLAFPLISSAQERYKTENVIIAVMDGVRWSETFGDPEHKLIPHMWNELRPQGTLYTNFYNNHITITRQGHSTIATGTWQSCRNGGPRQTMPTIFDYIRDELGLPQEKVWVLFGKGKYAYAPWSSFPAYGDRFKPSFEIGIGENSLEDDERVFRKLIEVMDRYQPKLIFVNFGYTDHSGHTGKWEEHTEAIRHLDELFAELWKRIQAHPAYRDKTTLFLTNDHGRHLDGVKLGFQGHGDACEGCRHIMLLVLGPDIKKGVVIDRPAYLTDIAPTVGELLGFQTPLARGEVLKDCLVRYLGLNRKIAVTETAKKAVEMEELARRDLVRWLADRVIGRYYEGRLESLEPSPQTAMLLWGMLSAYDKEGDERYLSFVRSWCEMNISSSSPYAGLVMAELTYRLRGPEERVKFLSAARRMCEEAVGELEETVSEGDAQKLALLSIFIASVGEAAKERELVSKASEAVIGYLRGMKREKAESTPDDPWLLLALAFIRSHGLPFKMDTPQLRKECILQTFIAVRDLPETGGIWADPLQAALNVAAIKEFRRRVGLYGAVAQEVKRITEEDLPRIRPESQTKPTLEQVRRNITNQITNKINRDFDFTVDLLRFYAEQLSKDELGTGALLLALDPKRRISYEPRTPSPRG